MTNSNTYTIRIECTNCSKTSNVRIPKGTPWQQHINTTNAQSICKNCGIPFKEMPIVFAKGKAI